MCLHGIKLSYLFLVAYMDGLEQDCSNSNASAMELL